MNGLWDSGELYVARHLREAFRVGGDSYAGSTNYEPVLRLYAEEGRRTYWTAHARHYRGKEGHAVVLDNADQLPSIEARTHSTEEHARDHAVSWLTSMTLRGYFNPTSEGT